MRRDAEPVTLSSQEQNDLRCLAGLIIPASETYGIPAASDDRIFTDILRSLDRDAAAVKSALGALARSANANFSELDDTTRHEAAARFREENGATAVLLSRVIFQCYYRDDRVLKSLDIEAQPPFPVGRVFDQGDWSVLDVARRRAPSWRRVE